MSTTSMESMLNTLFLAPGRASLEAEKGYREIWAKWLQSTLALIGGDAGDKSEKLKALLSLAPVMKVNGVIELGLTMRVASLEKADGSLSVGVGPIGLSGSYSRQTAEESALSVRASFTMTNAEVSLESYLGKHGIDLTKPADLDRAVALLQK